MIKKLLVLLVVTGLLVGPAYWVRAKFFTGDDAALVTLTALPTEPGKARTWQSGPIQLDAGMAPVGLVLHAQGRYTAGVANGREPRDRYSATLSRAGESAQPLTFSLGVKRVTDEPPSLREHLLLMQKVQPGPYLLTISQAAEPAIEIDQMQLQVRQHLQEPDPDILMAGLAMFMIGLLGLVLV